MSIINASVPIIDFTTVGNVGDSGQIQAGHVLTTDSFPDATKLLGLFNLNDNSDASGNGSTLNDADAYNGSTGIFNVANEAHLGVAGQHLQADAVANCATGDIDISIGGWAKMTVSGGLIAFGTNSALQKIQIYTDANGYAVFDVAGVTATNYKVLNGAWHHYALVYDAANSCAYCYVDGKQVNTLNASSNLAIQASPSVWINSKTDGTLETANYIDECFVYEGQLTATQIAILCGIRFSIPVAFIGKTFGLNCFCKTSDLEISNFEFIELKRTTNYIYSTGFNSIDSSSSLKIEINNSSSNCKSFKTFYQKIIDSDYIVTGSWANAYIPIKIDKTGYYVLSANFTVAGVGAADDSYHCFGLNGNNLLTSMTGNVIPTTNNDSRTINISLKKQFFSKGDLISLRIYQINSGCLVSTSTTNKLGTITAEEV